MVIVALPEAHRTRLLGVLSRLASPFDGERAAAGLLASRMLSKFGLNWDSVIVNRPPTVRAQTDFLPNWHSDPALCRRHVGSLSEWEGSFIRSLAARHTLTAKQRGKLAEIAAELRRAGAA